MEAWVAAVLAVPALAEARPLPLEVGAWVWEVGLEVLEDLEGSEDSVDSEGLEGLEGVL